MSTCTFMFPYTKSDIPQKQLALELNIASTTMNGYINNRREPEHKILKQIANYFHVSIDYLLRNRPSDSTDHLPPSLTKHEILFLLLQRTYPRAKEIVDELLKLMHV